MSSPAEPDRLIHPPARLRLMTIVCSVDEIQFVTLRERLDVSDSVLSKHLTVLADAGYVQTRKGSHEGRRTTWVTAPRKGRRALQRHVAALREMIALVPDEV